MEFMKEQLRAIFRWITGVSAMIVRLDLFTVAWDLNLAWRNALVILMEFLTGALQISLRFVTIAGVAILGLYLFNVAWRNELVTVLFVLFIVFLFVFSVAFPNGRFNALKLLADVSNLLHVPFIVIWAHWVADNGRNWAGDTIQNLRSSEVLVFFVGMLVIILFGSKINDYLLRLANQLRRDRERTMTADDDTIGI